MRWILLPLYFIYNLVLAMRDLYFRFSTPQKLPGFVISIGNIEAGGTGKTPLVMAISSYFLQKKNCVAILSRGYKSNLRRGEFAILKQGQVILGKKDLKNADEGMMLSQALPECYVILGAKRFQNSTKLVSELQITPDIWILDDGFQHRSILRNCNIALTHKLGLKPYDWTFPIGLLREPTKALKRADIILYREQPVAGFETQFKLEFHRGPFLDTDGSVVLFESLKNVALVTAIAHPESFRLTAESIGLNVVSLSFKPDHHPFLAAEIDPIFEKVDQIAITEKDFWRQPEFWNNYRSKVIRVTHHADLPSKFLEIIEKLYRQYIN